MCLHIYVYFQFLKQKMDLLNSWVFHPFYEVNIEWKEFLVH